MNNEIFDEKVDCCGCGACQAVCPKDAIEMVEDEYGFVYPKINEDKCIKCGLCKKTCAFKQTLGEKNTPEVLVAASNNENVIMKSASGGVFFEIASGIINKDGVVYGCSMENEENKLYPKHIRVDTIPNLKKLQGSKYIQSECGNIYKMVKKDLLKNKIVLFSGTPCQVMGLKSYLGNKEFDNLYLIDIICHGVPSRRMFQDYISSYEKNNDCKVTEYFFRDKEKGWGLNYKIVFDKNGKSEYVVEPSYESSFYQLFLDSSIYRENCYTCPYAKETRISDMTIGDYWGIEEEHPSLSIDVKKGVSCIIVNTEKGCNLVKEFGLDLHKEQSELYKVVKHNHQLKFPSRQPKERKKIMISYKEYGYDGVEKLYRRTRLIKNSIKKIRDKIKGK